MKVKDLLVEKIALHKKNDVALDQGYENVYTDSRQEVNNGLFVPIVGERFDGHDFVHQASKNGASGALWQKDKQVPVGLPADFQLYFVEDTLKGLQQLAHLFRKEINPIVIGVTGSNGKTTTKDLVETVLQSSYITFKTQGNFNNHIGLPLTILSMPADCEVLILEMGMNHFHEISLLSKIAEPDFAIVTNIGESHIEQLGSREGIAKAKMEIVDGLRPGGKIIVDGDEPLLEQYMTNDTILCGYSTKNDVQITSIKGSTEGFRFTLNNGDTEYQLPLLGRHNVKNATLALTIARELGVQEERLYNGLKAVRLTGMRLEKQIGKNKALIINDAYNASPTSMIAAIHSVMDLSLYEKKVLILGDMYELGREEEALHRKVASVIQPPITHVFTVGEKGAWIGDELNQLYHNSMEVEVVLKKEDLLNKVIPLLSEKTVVLIKASRGMKLETVVKELV